MARLGHVCFCHLLMLILPCTARAMCCRLLIILLLELLVVVGCSRDLLLRLLMSQVLLLHF